MDTDRGSGGVRASPPDRTTTGPFIGVSLTVRNLLEQAMLAAPSQAGVVICGERGTGRRSLARMIHAHSRGGKESGPFIDIDCRQGGPQLLESQLFGYRASQPADPHAPVRVTRNSRLYEARGGTLYLRYPGELPLIVQARLARVLRDGEILDMGIGAPCRFPVRAIAAVEPPFSTFAEDGKVHRDFYQRLAVIRIDLPPLRSRREDIPQLAAFLLREACQQTEVPAKTLTRQSLLLLSALPWRGNVRELRDFMAGVVSSVPGRTVTLANVLASVKLGAGTVSVTAGRTLHEARANFEREYITAVLAQHRGRIAETAKALGIQRTNLYRKIRQLGVTMPGKEL